MRGIPKRALPHTVTLFNFISSGVYAAVILEHVYSEGTKKANIDKTGAANADSIFMLIDYINTNVKDRGGNALSYLPSKEYQALANKAGHWTLQDGSKDLFVVGLTDPSKDGDINTVKSAYDTHAVKVVDTLYHPFSTKIHHFEVSGA